MTQSNTKYIFGAVAIASLLGYGVYFDYQRRNNVQFRKKLAQQRREAKKLSEAYNQKINNSFAASSSFALPDEEIPTTNEGREQYFMKNLQLGEQLMQQGPAAYDAAATCFYRALQVYPEPQKLLEVLSQSLPEFILNLIIQKMATEVRQAQTDAANGPKLEEIE